MEWTANTPTTWADFDHFPEWDELEAARSGSARTLGADPGSIRYFIVTTGGKREVAFYSDPDILP